MPGPAELLAARIRSQGPIGFDAFMEAALYGEGGFYTSGGHAGRRGDFLTSPEVGPLFGAVLAGALDGWWHDLGRPDPFVVVDAGAGRGTLARSVLAARPVCAGALRYVLVERSATQRAAHREGLPLEPPTQAFATPPAAAEDEAATAVPRGPIAVSLAELPTHRFAGVIIANELLDNLPTRLYQRIEGRWWELLVTLQGDGFGLDEVPTDAGWLDALVPDAPEGAIVPGQHAAAAWVRDALGLLTCGRLLVVDYGVATTAELARRPWTDWLRTYVAHGRGAGVLADPGTQDITCEVAFDQLPPPSRRTSQAEWLTEHGIEELVDEGRAIWRERAAIGDLVAFAARSRVRGAEALTDPGGLGSFVVAEWVVEG